MCSEELSKRVSAYISGFYGKNKHQRRPHAKVYPDTQYKAAQKTQVKTRKKVAGTI
jgi:predicted porin